MSTTTIELPEALGAEARAVGFEQNFSILDEGDSMSLIREVIETAALAEGRIAVRNSRFPAGPALVFTAGAWEAFIGRCDPAQVD